MASAPNARSEVYPFMDPKNWSVELLQQGWNVDGKQYSAICSFLEKEMLKLDLLGQRLNTATQRKRLQEALNALQAKFEHVFSEVPQPWKDKSLLILAQKCNYNQKRRKKCRSRQPSESPSRTTQPDPTILPVQSISTPIYVERPLTTTIIRITRLDNSRVTICRPKHLVAKTSNITQLSIDDLEFLIFKQILQEDIGYNVEKDTILYRRGGSEELKIQNERSWRVALEELHDVAVGDDHLLFYVKGK